MTVDHSWQVRPDLSGHHEADGVPGPPSGCTAVRPGDPREIGGYPLVALLASGHKGCTYLGDSDAGPVAIKLLEPAWIEEVGGPSSLTRSLATARRLDTDTGIAAVLDVRMENGQSFVVSEFVPGPSVEDVVRTSGGLPPEAVVRLAVATAAGLATIHGSGLAHGSLHPRHVLLGPDGPRIVDVGLCPGPRRVEPPRGDPDSGLPRRNASTRGVQQVDVRAWAAMIAYAAAGDESFLDPAGPSVVDPASLAALPDDLARLVHECLVAGPGDNLTAHDLVHRLPTRSDGRSSSVGAEDGPPSDQSPTAPAGTEPEGTGPAGAGTAGRRASGRRAAPSDGEHPDGEHPAEITAETPAVLPPVVLPPALQVPAVLRPAVLPPAVLPAPDRTAYHLPSTAELALDVTPFTGAAFGSCPPTAEIPVILDGPMPEPPRGRVAAFLHWVTGGTMSHGRVSLLATAALLGTLGGSLLGTIALHEVTSPRPASAAPAPAMEPAPASDPPAVALPPEQASRGRAACSAVYRVVERWPGGFKGEVTVTAGDVPLRVWRVTLPLAGAQGVTQWWNTSVTTLGTEIEARNASWNGTVQPGASTTFGFVATRSRVPADRTVDCVAE